MSKLIRCIALSAAFALSLQPHAVAQEDTNTMVTDCTQYGSDTTEGTLAAALSVRAAVIDFECSGTVIVPELILSSDVVINGQPGLTFSGNGSNRVLRVEQV